MMLSPNDVEQLLAGMHMLQNFATFGLIVASVALAIIITNYFNRK